MNTLRSLIAILAGIIFIVALSTGTDYVLEKYDIFPTYPKPLYIWWMVLLAAVYRFIYQVAGSYLTAVLAPSRPVRHALIIGFIGLFVNVISVIIIWGPGRSGEFAKVAQQTPIWYSILLIVTAVPSAWLGGLMKTKSA